MGKSFIKKVSRDSVKNMEYYKVSNQDSWKVSISSETYEVSNSEMEIELFDQHEMAAVLRHICVSCTTAAQRTAHKLFSLLH